MVKTQKQKFEDVSKLKLHLVYDLYGCIPETGQVVCVKTKNILGNISHRGYMNVNVKGKTTEQVSMSVHRFIWECVNGTIEDGKEIDHIDENKLNNKISNLQLLTHRENLLKSIKKRNYKFVKYNHSKRMAVKSTCEDGNIDYHESVSMAARDTGLNVGIVSYSVRKLNHCKGGISKTDGKYYSFEYLGVPLPKRKQQKRINNTKKIEPMNEIMN